MQKKTKSILEELDSLYVDRYSELRERKYIVENRATNVIASAIRLIEQIEELYTEEQADNLQRKLLNAIKNKDPRKFTRSVQRTDQLNKGKE